MLNLKKMFPVFVGPFLLRGEGCMTRDRTKAWPDPCKQEAPAFPLWAAGHLPTIQGCGPKACDKIFGDVMIFYKRFRMMIIL